MPFPTTFHENSMSIIFGRWRLSNLYEYFCVWKSHENWKVSSATVWGLFTFHSFVVNNNTGAGVKVTRKLPLLYVKRILFIITLFTAKSGETQWRICFPFFCFLAVASTSLQLVKNPFEGNIVECLIFKGGLRLRYWWIARELEEVFE